MRTGDLFRGAPAGLPASVPTGRTLVMGVLNVTPDSFSDGGAYVDQGAALAHGLDMVARGADLVDVGGESTRPGATPVDPAEEIRRVEPVVRALAERGVVVSIDTLHAATAAAALEAGARIVNDVSAGVHDPEILHVAARAGAVVVLQHRRGEAGTMTALADYDDLVPDVVAEVAERRDAALAAGIAADRIVLDPGLGFAKEGTQSWEVLERLEALAVLGHPLLVGTSRKRFLAAAVADGPDRTGTPVDRDAATAATTALLAARGVWAVRVHDVRPSADAVAVAAALAPFAGGDGR
ncbi:dihydropteroate synthase [Georgenia sp. Z1344]|uniref:dihydropteroate synthase n=1 Tax=Georgenia sp. Z1344 TaxID=3416706 RepID=UPI003CF0E1A2